ncbi:hypothetical protein E4T47_06689 [Aureobasidium subglaciale]|nr:hypothetical protein E4T47_06689 [Aureobasidium subglaciale]
MWGFRWDANLGCSDALTRATQISDASTQYLSCFGLSFCLRASLDQTSSIMVPSTIYSLQVQTTPSPSPSLSLPAVVQTTLIPVIRRDNPPDILTNAHTCGYTSGAWSSAVTCGPSHSCTYYTTPYSAPNFGCCSEGLDCGYVSTCLDYGAKGNPNTGSGIIFSISNEQFLCGPAAPYCSRLLLYGTTYAPGSSYSFYFYNCLTKSVPMVIAYQTTLDERGAASSSVSSVLSTTEITETTASSILSTSSSSDASTQSGIPSLSASHSTTSQTETPIPIETTSKRLDLTSATSASGTPTSSSEASSGSLSQTSQIGIAVGVSIGVGVVLASLAFWFLRYRKAKKVQQCTQQGSQFQPSYVDHTVASKSFYPFDNRFSSFRTHTSATSEMEGQALYELGATSRRHELAAERHR